MSLFKKKQRETLKARLYRLSEVIGEADIEVEKFENSWVVTRESAITVTAKGDGFLLSHYTVTLPQCVAAALGLPEEQKFNQESFPVILKDKQDFKMQTPVGHVIWKGWVKS